MASSFPPSSQDRGSPPRRDRYPPLSPATPGAASRRSRRPRGRLDLNPHQRPRAGKGPGRDPPPPPPLPPTQMAPPSGTLRPSLRPPAAARGSFIPPTPFRRRPRPTVAKSPSPPPPIRAELSRPHPSAPWQRPPNPAAAPCPGTHHGGPAWLRGAVGAEGCTGRTLRDLPAARLASHWVLPARRRRLINRLTARIAPRRSLPPPLPPTLNRAEKRVPAPGALLGRAPRTPSAAPSAPEPRRRKERGAGNRGEQRLGNGGGSWGR